MGSQLKKMKLFGLLALSSSAFAGMCGNYGCVVDMDTTGCSGTCNQDGYCSGSGVKCSGDLASHDFSKLKGFRTNIKATGSSKSIDHCIIGAIISRESRAGSLSRLGMANLDGAIAMVVPATDSV